MLSAVENTALFTCRRLGVGDHISCTICIRLKGLESAASALTGGALTNRNYCTDDRYEVEKYSLYKEI